MFHLLHLHFESVLRALAAKRPCALKQVYRTFNSPAYHAASSARRLLLLEQEITSVSTVPDLFTKEIFERVVCSFFAELQRSQVEHVDLRIGITANKWQWMDTIADGIAVFERENKSYPQITLAFLAAFNFAKPFAQIDEMLALLLGDPFIKHTFVGIDINLSPADLPKFRHSVPSLLAAQQQGMKINLHLGELFDNSFSKEVLSYLVPHRIGHGVRLLEDESLVDFLLQHDICLDMCPTSNTRLGVFDWQQPNNPAKKAMQLGIPVTINTDDPVLFQTCLPQEMALARLSDQEERIIQATGRSYGYHQR